MIIHYHHVFNFVAAAAGRGMKVEREGVTMWEKEYEMKNETKEAKEKEMKKENEINREREGKGEREGEGEGKEEGKEREKRVSENFSVVCVLDAPLGALLLYYLPHTQVQGEGEKISKEKVTATVKKKEDMGRNEAHKVGKETKRGRERDRERESKVTNDMSYEQTTAFCVIDLVWLLQLKEGCTSLDNYNDSNNNYNDNARNTQNRPISPVKRLNSPNNIEDRKGKLNEVTSNDYYKTTIKIRETVDRVFFLKNTLVVITRSFSSKISHQNYGISSGEVPDPNVIVGKFEKEIAIEVTKTKTLSVGNNKSIESDDNNDSDNSNNDNNNGKYNEERDYKKKTGAERSLKNVEEMKVIGGTIYVLSFHGK